MSKFRTSYPFNSLPGALVACVALLSLACSSAAPPRSATELGAATSAKPDAPPLPNEKQIREVFDLPLTKVDGTSFKLADFKGKVMVVDFWATWCGPCVRQAPQLAQLSKRYRDRGLEVIGLTSDEKSDEAKVKEFIKRVGINYEVGYASNWVSRAFLKGSEDETGAPPIPQLFVISRNGSVVEHLIGENSQRGIDYLEQIVARELSLNTVPQ